MNPLGIPETLDRWQQLAGRLRAIVRVDDRHTNLAYLREAIKRDLRIAEATGRWQLTPDGPEPTVYLPGDVLALRSLAAIWDIRDADLGDGQGTVGRLLLDATPYFVPGPVALGLLQSYAPDEATLAGLHLPYDSVAVYFGASIASPTLELVPAALVDEWMADVEALPTEGFGLRVLLGDMPFVQAGIAVADYEYDPAEQPARVRIEALLLLAEEGSLRDEIAWLVAAETPTRVRERPVRALVPGLRSCCGWADPVHSLAAAVAWADWTAEPPLRLPGLLRRDLRQLRRGPMRRAEQAGALANVRVIDARPVKSAEAAEPGGGHASPVAHLRRGHWRRVRVGPKRDWRYQGRWIAPTIVNPDHGSLRPVVYRLPKPNGAEND